MLAFCSCIPRSGSTLLNCLLGQNPSIHVTPTNELSTMFQQARDTWMLKDAFKAQGLHNVEPRIRNMLGGILNGFYKPELSAGRTVIDKSRAWLRYIELLELVLERPVKIIVPVRPIEDVLASFEVLYRKASLTVLPYSGPLDALRQLTTGRAQSYLAAEAVLGSVICNLRDAIDRGLQDRLLIVPFRYFTSHPKEMADWLTSELGLQPFDYDVNNVKQLTHEDDGIYGISLHTIREGKIQVAPRPICHQIFRDDFLRAIEQEYGDIATLANRKPAFLKGA